MLHEVEDEFLQLLLCVLRVLSVGPYRQIGQETVVDGRLRSAHRAVEAMQEWADLGELDQALIEICGDPEAEDARRALEEAVYEARHLTALVIVRVEDC